MQRCDSMTVFVRGLKVEAHIGVHAHERGRSQPLIIEVEIALENPRVESLADTVNYERVVEIAHALAARGHIDLVEEYAERVGAALLEDPKVARVRVRIDKPLALEPAEAAGCEAVFVRG